MIVPDQYLEAIFLLNVIHMYVKRHHCGEKCLIFNKFCYHLEQRWL